MVVCIYMQLDWVIVIWVMGVMQYCYLVVIICEIVNFLFLCGNVGWFGIGLCFVCGYFNVQGDCIMGINEKFFVQLIDVLEWELGVSLLCYDGYNVLGVIGVMLDGLVRVFIGLGGNFVCVMFDSVLIVQVLFGLGLMVYVVIKLNYLYLLLGVVLFILFCLGWIEIDKFFVGICQIVMVEDFMSMVYGLGGINLFVLVELKFEIGIIVGIVVVIVGSVVVDWQVMVDDYDLICDMIGCVLLGFYDYNECVCKLCGFWLCNLVVQCEWCILMVWVNFGVDFLFEVIEWQKLQGDGCFVLQIFWLYDQYNIMIYGMDDRYCGVYGECCVVFVNFDDIVVIGVKVGDWVDIIGLLDDGIDRVVQVFWLVVYDLLCGCIVGYYLELNVLVLLGVFGECSFMFNLKFILVCLYFL